MHPCANRRCATALLNARPYRSNAASHHACEKVQCPIKGTVFHTHDRSIEIRDTSVSVTVNLSTEGVLIPHDSDVGWALHAFAPWPFATSSSAASTLRRADRAPSTPHHARRWATGVVRRPAESGNDVIFHGFRSYHPSIGPVRVLAGNLEHHRA